MSAPPGQYDHLIPQSPPPPPPPQQQQQQQQTKPRSFSFRSDRSHHSGASKSHLHDLHETHNEKESKRLHSKADPSLAINEAEPAAIAAMVTASSHVSLRSIQHKDLWGNPIADPDKSNPTRNRWERPLDTIRGFEAAIDGAYTRKSMQRPDVDSVANWNRRGSHQTQNQPRFPQDNYYGSRPTSFRTDSQLGPTNSGTARNSYMDPQAYGGGGGYNNSYPNNGAYYGGHNSGYGRPVLRERNQRMQSEPQYQVYGREQNVYPIPHKDRSYETVASAAPSGNSDLAGYQTDPTSSDNSSIDRASPAKRQEPVNDYGIGFSQPQAYQAPNFSVGAGANSSASYGNPRTHQRMEADQFNSSPAVPRKEASVLKRESSQLLQNAPEQRKSWFSRRFSKNT